MKSRKTCSTCGPLGVICDQSHITTTEGELWCMAAMKVVNFSDQECKLHAICRKQEAALFHILDWIDEGNATIQDKQKYEATAIAKEALKIRQNEDNP